MAMTCKKWAITTILSTCMLLVGLGSVTIYIDPYFHYHAPLQGLEYPISNERYQNDGIIRHFPYNAIITGTSMTENFKASELDRLFHVNSIKVPFSGGGHKEINAALKRAIFENPDITYIVRGVDDGMLLQDKDWMRYDSYPDYLYDDFLPNDVNYILNKEILNASLYVLTYTKSGGKTTNFDEYANWMHLVDFGKEAIESLYKRPGKGNLLEFTKADKQMVTDNIRQNVTELIARHPNITFYLFFPPYSIYTWDSWNQSGNIERQLAAQKLEIELLLEYENVKLFSFFQNYEMICNPDNYKDHSHYSETINSQILQWMKQGDYQLTKENYLDYYNEIHDFYRNYDYDSLFLP